jgi:hypothetical protein
MTVWAVVDGEVNIRTKNKIINGTFFDQTCKKCGKTFALTYPVLFEDDSHYAMVYYAQTQSQEIDAVRAIDSRRELFEAANDYSIRITRSPQRFQEKVRILDCCMDDRIVEIMKIALLEKLSGEDTFGHVDEVLCWCDDNGGDFQLEIFSDSHFIVSIRRDFYDYLKSKCQATLDRKEPNPTIVDMTWALEFLEDNNFQCI